MATIDIALLALIEAHERIVLLAYDESAPALQVVLAYAALSRALADYMTAAGLE